MLLLPYLVLLALAVGAPLDTNGHGINGIDLNGGTWNGFTWNEFNWNGGSYNGGNTWNGLYFNNTALNDLHLSNFSVQDNATVPLLGLLKYLVTCALPGDETWTARLKDISTQFKGNLGLAPNYDTAPLTRNDEEWVSACLLAHVNAFGRHILISVRNAPKIGSTPEERKQFPVYEGAFFGNMFHPNATAFSCQGTPAPQALAESEDRQWRVCTETHPNCPYSVGYCADHCTGYEAFDGYSQCTYNGTTHDEVLNVYLSYETVDSENSAARLGQMLFMLVLALFMLF